MKNHPEILCVEDNSADLLLLETACKIAGFKPTMISMKTGDAGLNYLQERRNDKQGLPDMILLDLNLPRVSGLEVLKKIKVDSVFAGIPTIVYSGTANAEEQKQVLDLHADEFWGKPNNLNEAIFIAKRLKNFTKTKSADAA